MLDGHAQTLKQHDERLGIVVSGLSDLTETVTHNANTLHAIAARTPQDVATFFGRLRWLVTGR